MTRRNPDVHELLAEYQRKYGQLSQKAIKLIQKYIDEGMSVEAAVKKALSESNFFSHNEKSIVDAVLKSATGGYGQKPTDPITVRKVLLHSSWAPDKMNLSQRLHGARGEVRQIIIDSISTSMRLGKGWTQTARDIYDGYGYGNKISRAELPEYMKRLVDQSRKVLAGDRSAMDRYLAAIKQAERQIGLLAADGSPTKALKAAFSELLKATKELNQKAMEKAIYVAVEEKSRYIADRIARTEISAAWGDGFLAKHRNDDDVIAFRWLLNSRHPRYDICDIHANIDLYGLGPGVYPKDRFPKRPAHPHCMCPIEPVYAGEINIDPHKEAEILNKAKFNPKAMEEFLGALPRDKQLQLFGEYGLKAWRKGEDWRQHLRLWEGHEDAKGRLDPESFVVKPKESGIIKLRGEYSPAYEKKLLDVAKAFKSAGLNYPREHALNRIVGRISQERIPDIEMIIEVAKNGNQYVTTNGDIARVGVNIKNQKEPYFSVHFNSEGDIITVSPRKKSVLDKWSMMKND